MRVTFSYVINENYVTPVGASKEFVAPETKIPSREQITSLLKKRGFEIELGDPIKGGSVSQVFSGVGPGKRRLVVKQTNDSVPYDPTLIILSAKGHFVDTALLQFLDGVVRVPQVVQSYNDVPLTVMEDLRADGFILMSDILQTGVMPPSGTKVGLDIALIQSAFSQHHEFVTITSGRQEFYERGLELRMAFPGEQKEYNALEERFTTANQQLIAVDTLPKNMFVNENSTPAWIDFGRSTWADRDFALPNCLAHFVIYALAGSVERSVVVEFIRSAVNGYRTMLPIDDEPLCKYLACEVLHRWSGKWIDGIETAQQKLALVEFGLTVFERDVSSFDELCSLIEN